MQKCKGKGQLGKREEKRESGSLKDFLKYLGSEARWLLSGTDGCRGSTSIHSGWAVLDLCVSPAQGKGQSELREKDV